MRTALAIALTLAALARTGAAGDRTCYAGTQVDGPHTYRVVGDRQLDRAASQIREHVWISRDPARELDLTFAVAADGHSFELRLGQVRAHGQLEGTPWAWTGYHAELASKDVKLTIEATLSGDLITSTSKIERAGLTLRESRTELRAFDCAELAKRRAALRPAAP